MTDTIVNIDNSIDLRAKNILNGFKEEYEVFNTYSKKINIIYFRIKILGIIEKIILLLFCAFNILNRYYNINNKLNWNYYDWLHTGTEIAIPVLFIIYSITEYFINKYCCLLTLITNKINIYKEEITIFNEAIYKHFDNKLINYQNEIDKMEMIIRIKNKLN